MELYDYWRLCEDVPTAEEMDLATEMMLDALADELAEGIEEEKREDESIEENQ